MTDGAKRILIVDDVPENLELLEARLVAAGYSSVSAEDGEGALRLLESGRVDAIVSGIPIPDVDGDQLCRACKSDPRLSTIPFIFYTAACTDEQDRTFALRPGAEASLLKPTETRSFFDVLDAAIASASDEIGPMASGDEMLASDRYRQHSAQLGANLSTTTRQQRLLVTAIAQTSEGVAILSADGALQYANSAFALLLGCSTAEAPSVDPFRDGSGSFPSSAHEAQWQAVLARSHWSGRVRRQTLDGIVVECQESLAPVHAVSGDLTSFVLVSRDVTEQRRLESRAQTRERMAAIGTLAGGIAHDFNNVLAGIVGLAELTAQDVADQPEVLGNVQQILETCERAREIIEPVLALGRKTEPHLKPVRLRPLVVEVMRLFETTLPPTVRLESSFLTEVDTVLANASHFHRVLTNLLTNARQAIGEGPGTITVTLAREMLAKTALCTHERLAAGPHLRLSVKDNGRGIVSDDLPRIFEPYFTTRTNTFNAGLGLTLVHSIVCAHDGDIQVRSSAEEGTIFHILLPLRPSAEGPALPTEGPESVGGTERVLIVDDELVVLDVLRRTLRSLGYTVVSASGLSEAVSVFEREAGRFDLVVTDKQMPGGSGFDVVRALRSVRPELPAVLCSGYLDEPDVHRARQEGIDEVLAKPVRRAQLAQCVRAVLARRASPSGARPSQP